jgi:hypothetical protein
MRHQFADKALPCRVGGEAMKDASLKFDGMKKWPSWRTVTADASELPSANFFRAL